MGAALSALVIAGALLGVRLGPADVHSVADIPSLYAQLYRSAARRFELGADGWTVLAGVGKVECDHGRSTAVGCHRGEANFAGARGPAQFLDGTWTAYGVDGDGDGQRDVYAPADAVFGMANYLHASGAPLDGRRPLFAYTHSRASVDDVLSGARRYAATPTQTVFVAPEPGSGWLASVPGTTGIRCDARIVS